MSKTNKSKRKNKNGSVRSVSRTVPKTDPDGFVCSEIASSGKPKSKRPLVSFRTQPTGSVIISGGDQEMAATATSAASGGRKGMYGDPVIEQSAPFLYEASVRSTATGYNYNPDDAFREEAELFTDTFSFLMTGRYPCEKLTKKNDNNPMSTGTSNTAFSVEDEACGGGAEVELTSMALEPTTAVRAISKNERKLSKVDPDWICFPFVTGFFVLSLQIFIYLIVLIATIDDGAPPPADTLLRMAQFFALIVALYTQSDLVDAIFLLTEGSERFEEITTPFKFTVSNIARFIAGNLGIVASFALVIYAPDVIDLLLNFTAIEFVATLDDSAFQLAGKGFLGLTLKKKAKEIEDFRYEAIIRKSSTYIKVFAYVCYFVLYCGGLIVIMALQHNRIIGVDNEVYFQFDDTNVPSLFGISGVYVGCTGFGGKRNGKKITRTLAYVDASYQGNCPEIDEHGMYPANSFYFCKELEGWVFMKQSTLNPCTNYIVRSFLDNGEAKPSDAYDILTHSDARWIIEQPITGGEAFLDDVFVMPTDTFKVSYNCTDGLQSLADLRLGQESSTFRVFTAPLPGNYYPIFEDETSYFEKFSLVYRQVFFGAFRTEITTEELGQRSRGPTCENQASDEESIFSLMFFDGLRWQSLGYFDLAMFVDYAIEKYNDVDPEECHARIFLKYYLRDKSWMLNETIAIPGSISAPLHFVTPGDTVVPTGTLEWFEAEVQFSSEIVRPGRSRNEIGNEFFQLSTSCYIEEVPCLANEIRFNIDLLTSSFPEETAVLVQRNPSFQNMSAGYPEFLDEYNARLEEFGNPYETAEIVPISETSLAVPGPTNFEKPIVKDFRFENGETVYHLEACLPFEKGSSFCAFVIVLNPISTGLSDYFLGWDETVERSFGDLNGADGVDCRQYSLCYFEEDVGPTNSTFVKWIYGPDECSVSEIEELYPGIIIQPTF